MTTLKAVFLAAIALTVTSAGASCNDAFTTLLGLRLGPVAAHESHLTAGVVVEGHAELIPGVLMESLQGHSGEFAVDRVMAFIDGNQFFSIKAVLDSPDQSDHGLAHLTRAVASATGAESRQDGDGTVFNCDDGRELTVKPTQWDTGPRVLVYLTDPQAQKASRQHVESFCADHRGQYACKR